MGITGQFRSLIAVPKTSTKSRFFLKTRLSLSRYLQANWFKIIENEEIYKRMSCRVANSKDITTGSKIEKKDFAKIRKRISIKQTIFQKLPPRSRSL